MVDIALAYDQTRRCCDVVFNGRDFVLDATPASAMLFSICANRRAKPDDDLPTPIRDWADPESFTARGGYPGDALDPTGALTGSRLFLRVRANTEEQTRVDVENDLAECVGWLESLRNLALAISVRFIGPEILGYRVRAGATTIALTAALA